MGSKFGHNSILKMRLNRATLRNTIKGPCASSAGKRWRTTIKTDGPLDARVLCASQHKPQKARGRSARSRQKMFIETRFLQRKWLPEIAALKDYIQKTKPHSVQCFMRTLLNRDTELCAWHDHFTSAGATLLRLHSGTNILVSVVSKKSWLHQEATHHTSHARD